MSSFLYKVVASVDSVSLITTPQIVFIGKSNVGKSSLINALLKRKLAYSSKTPGKTRAINLFKTEQEFLLVDVPGYGYAKRSKDERQIWENIVDLFLRTNVSSIKLVFLLIDCRHELKEIDIQAIHYIKSMNLNNIVILTKSDKKMHSGLRETLESSYTMETIAYGKYTKNTQIYSIINKYMS
ncbi:MAG: putative GTP-binding protein engB [Candidatus Xenolissoclinum pacificiensis L6]|uniref:Probable GTP-binding protein EngB n=1 Tax=Candidatus Xenolissoclinum pacificiensis L6 TaxID=1401685 RepID=W2V275_9RICK|nr:MAG: putative GTP-binding protein engB [Candidatus Xenolissoclinum pacificiensis L6]